MKNTIINRKATIKIARALEELCDEVVFVGGAMVSLYIDDPHAEDIRPTKDIDLTFQISTVGELERIRTVLNGKGFREATDSKVICRFHCEDILVDVMSTQQVGWAPGNQWFLLGFEQAMEVTLDEVTIKLLPLPYFVATKFDAFFDRGSEDVYASKDLEDLVYLFNYTSTIVEDLTIAPDDVRFYLGEAVRRLKNDDSAMAAIPGHLFFENMQESIRRSSENWMI